MKNEKERKEKIKKKDINEIFGRTRTRASFD